MPINLTQNPFSYNPSYPPFSKGRNKNTSPFIKRSLGENAVAGQSRLGGTAYRVLEIAAFIPTHPAHGGTGLCSIFVKGGVKNSPPFIKGDSGG
jgi:hypothetical protein